MDDDITKEEFETYLEENPNSRYSIFVSKIEDDYFVSNHLSSYVVTSRSKNRTLRITSSCTTFVGYTTERDPNVSFSPNCKGFNTDHILTHPDGNLFFDPFTSYKIYSRRQESLNIANYAKNKAIEEYYDMVKYLSRDKEWITLYETYMISVGLVWGYERPDVRIKELHYVEYGQIDQYKTKYGVDMNKLLKHNQVEIEAIGL